MYRVHYNLSENDCYKTEIRFPTHITLIITKFHPLNKLQEGIETKLYDYIIDTIHVASVLTIF